MMAFVRRWRIGPPLATAQAVHERLTKTVALAVFSSDALSSIAYATEEILLVLAVAAAATASRSFFFVLPSDSADSNKAPHPQAEARRGRSSSTVSGRSRLPWCSASS